MLIPTERRESGITRAEQLIAAVQQSGSRTFPDSVHARSYMGYYHRALGQYDEAVKAFDHVLQIKPDSAYAHAQLGKAFTYLGNSQAAVEEFNRAFRIQPKLKNDAAYQGPFASPLAKLGQIDKALDACREAVRLDPNSAKA